MAFPPLGNSDHVVVLVSIDFPINLTQSAPFHRIAYDYSCADWDGLRDHLRDVIESGVVGGFSLELQGFRNSVKLGVEWGGSG